MEKLHKLKINEEYGEYQDMLDEAAHDLEYGDDSGSGYNEDGYYTWYLTINGNTLDELDLNTMEVKKWICREISYPVKDGHDNYTGLDTILTIGEDELERFDFSPEAIQDYVTLGCDEETLLDAIKYIQENGDKDRSDCKEVEWWLDYDIHYELIEENEDDEEDVEYVDEWQILYKDISDEDEYFEEDEEGAYARFKEVKDSGKVKQFIKKTYKVIDGEPEEDWVDVIYQDLNESLSLKNRKKSIHEKIKREYISPKRKFVYDEMEDETGMNSIEECEGGSVGGMASTGTAPTPAVGRVSASTVNGQAVPSKSSKKKTKKDESFNIQNIIKLNNELKKILDEDKNPKL